MQQRLEIDAHLLEAFAEANVKPQAVHDRSRPRTELVEQHKPPTPASIRSTEVADFAEHDLAGRAEDEALHTRCNTTIEAPPNAKIPYCPGETYAAEEQQQHGRPSSVSLIGCEHGHWPVPSTQELDGTSGGQTCAGCNTPAQLLNRSGTSYLQCGLNEANASRANLPATVSLGEVQGTADHDFARADEWMGMFLDFGAPTEPASAGLSPTCT